MTDPKEPQNIDQMNDELQEIDHLAIELQDFLKKKGSNYDLHNEFKSLLEAVDKKEKRNQLIEEGQDNDKGKKHNFDQKNFHITKGTPRALSKDVFGKIVANAANLARFTYALEDINGTIASAIDNNHQGINISYDIDNDRVLKDKHDKDEVKTEKFFKQTLKLFERDLIDNINLIHSYKVKDMGGTSYVATFHEIHEKENKDVTFEKWIIVGFRGTHGESEWKNTNLKRHKLDRLLLSSVPFKPLSLKDTGLKYIEKHNNWFDGFHVHEGFYNALSALTPNFHSSTNAGEPGPLKPYNIFKDVARLRETHPDYKLVVVGHSLGGALASLFGYEAQALGWNPTVLSVASPRVGAYNPHGIHHGLLHGLGHHQKEKARAEYFRKIYTLFDINFANFEHKFQAIKDCNVEEIFHPKNSYFINIINDADYVPKVPFGLSDSLKKFDGLGGIPIYIKTQESNDVDRVVATQSIYLLKEDEEFFKKVLHNIDFELVHLPKIHVDIGLELINDIKEFTDNGETFIKDLFSDLSDKSKKKVSVGDLFFAFLLVDPELYESYVHHVYYGLYYVSDEYNGAGILDFPEIKNSIKHKIKSLL